MPLLVEGILAFTIYVSQPLLSASPFFFRSLGNTLSTGNSPLPFVQRRQLGVSRVDYAFVASLVLGRGAAYEAS
jgi:hypothetical protein